MNNCQHRNYIKSSFLDFLGFLTIQIAKTKKKEIAKKSPQPK